MSKSKKLPIYKDRELHNIALSEEKKNKKENKTKS